MRRMKKWKLAAALTAASLLGSLAFPVRAATVSEENWDKQETVHVTAAPSGKAKEVEVEVILRQKGTGPIQDKSILTDIRNTEGDEEYTVLSDGTLSWQNQGEDIHYKGNADPASVPMEIDVSYTMDGVISTPQALTGKSGHLVIRFDYKNKLERTVEVEKKSYTVPVPLMAMTLVPLDEEVFSNVKVTNGKVISMDDSGLAVGMVLPGFSKVLNLQSLSYTEDVDIPEYFEISADVTDFSLDFTATVVSPGLLDDMDEEDLDAGNDFDGTAGDIDSAVDTMYEGADDLKDAVEQVEDGLGAIVAALKTGVETLSAQNKNLGRLFAQFQIPKDDPQTPDINESLTTLAGQIEGARQEAVKVNDVEAQKHLEEAQKMIEELTDTSGGLLAKIMEENAVSSAYVSGAMEGADKLKSAMKKMLEGVEEFRDGITEFRDNGSGELKKLARDADKLQSIMDTLKAMKRAGEDYTSFSGLAEGKKGNVSFLYETEEIED